MERVIDRIELLVKKRNAYRQKSSHWLVLASLQVLLLCYRFIPQEADKDD